MEVRYKFDIMAALKEKGYSSTRLRREKLLSESVMHHIRNGEPINMENIGRICSLLECQPGDILEAVKEDQK